METPLVANKRLDFPIAVNGLVHHARLYCGAVPGSGASGYDIVLRDSTTGVDITAAGNAFYTVVAPFFQNSNVNFDNFTLESLVGSAWLPIATGVSANPTASSNTYTPGSQLTMTMRDTNFHKVKLVLLEHVENVGIKVFPPGSGVIAALMSWFSEQPATGTPTGWNWVKGRSNLYVQSVISLTTDLNDKVRRRRGTQ